MDNGYSTICTELIYAYIYKCRCIDGDRETKKSIKTLFTYCSILSEYSFIHSERESEKK